MLRQLVRFYARRGPVILGIAFVLTLASVLIASRITIDADLERMLPDDAPSVQGLRDLEAKYGIVGRVNIVLSGEDPDQVKAAVTAAANVADASEYVDRVEVTRAAKFFRENRLLYIDAEDLDTVAERINTRIKWEKRNANPLFVSLGESEPPAVELDDIEAKYGNLEGDEYYCDEAGTTCIAFAFPNFSAGDLAKSNALIAQLRGSVEAELDANFDGVSVGFGGRFAKRVEQQAAVNEDLAKTSVLALSVLFLFLLVYFRGVLSAFWVFLPLLMGTIWAFAWAQLVFGSLNILTSFFGAVLLGLGIDYGIHILSRYLEALEERGVSPSNVEDAMVETLESAGRASIYAGITTVIAFGSLMASSFRAFFEYGVIALGGMALIVTASVVVLPCILLLVAGTKLQPRGTMSVHVAQRLTARGGRGAKTWRAILIAGLTALLLAAAVGLPKTSYEYDFRGVQATDLESWHLDDVVDPILGATQIPVVVLAEDDAHAQRIATELRRRSEELPEGDTMAQTVTLADAIPAEQPEKFEVLRDLHDSITGLPAKVFEDNELLTDFRAELTRVLDAGTITAASLPEALRVPFQRRDGAEHAVVLGFPSQRQDDVKEMERLAVVIRGLPGATDGTTVDGINDALLLVDIFESVKRDAVWMFLITLLGILITAFAGFRRPKMVLLLLATVGTSLLVATGLVGLFGVKFNFINMVVVPIWLGLGVDAAFHLMVRHEETPGQVDGFLATAIAVSAAYITSMIGFGALLSTGHGGLTSMGAVAVIGLASILATSLAIQSLVLNRFHLQ